MITENGMIVMAALAGAGIGILYLGLLWASVRALPRSRGAVIFLGLGLLRAALVMAALAVALFLDVPPIGIAAAVAGFLATRLVATRRADPKIGKAQWK